jgi:hypothetical protein
MKAFRFTLDRALHIRRSQLGIEQDKLQKFIRDREQLELQATSIRSEAAGARRLVSSQELIAAEEISTVPDYQRSAKHRLLKLDQQKQDLLTQTQEQRRKTFEAERKVKLLEQLRDRRFAQWSSMMEKEQEAFASDAYLARWTAQP